ncbi:uncharacterized protein LOC128712403 [Anopheles marshallii]|uniref:uncharacterized protein LOC128712403 n=1 Tax=Anopheles marshallii TaxID=1521116 RepID=UPI00237A3C38|nr:uncharacterized protein LOC128712403 [Anopheles marshallii]
MSYRLVVLLAVVQTMCWPPLYADEDPFQDEKDQCQITVSADMMKTFEQSSQKEVKCGEDLWSNFLLHYHQTQQNLTDCLKRPNDEDAPGASDVFCQQLLDDVQRELEQEHRKHSDELDKQLHAAQQEVQKQLNEKVLLEGQLNRLLHERAELVMDLLLANIAIGDTKQALANYNEFPAKDRTHLLHEQIVRSVYRVTVYQDQRLLNLLNFVREINAKDAKLDLYRLMVAEVQKRPSQRDGYIAVAFALNVKADTVAYNADQQLYTNLIVPVVARWKDQLANGNYKEVISFATQQPKYYEQMQTDLATVDEAKWVNLKFDLFVPYMNSLPKAAQRLEALRLILDQIWARNKQNFQTRLELTAKQVDICETFMNRTNNQDKNDRRSLDELKKQFGKFTSRKDYKSYLNASRKPSG